MNKSNSINAYLTCGGLLCGSVGQGLVDNDILFSAGFLHHTDGHKVGVAEVLRWTKPVHQGLGEHFRMCWLEAETFVTLATSYIVLMVK